MSVFCLPVGLLKDIEAMIRKFWWGCSDSARKIHWVSWKTLCSSKSIGGMGFRDLCQFNDALLGKQVWRLYHEKETLLYRVFRAKYFPSGDIFEAVQNLRCSYAWKSIMLARDVISNGALWRIRDGKDIQIWQHRWLPSPGSGKVLSPRLDQSLNVVQDLFISGIKTWNFELIDRHFLPWEADGIKSIPLNEHHNIDLLIWPHTSDGSYSVRSAYRLLVAAQAQNQPSSSSTEASKRLWKGVWRMEVPNKVCHFVWRAVGESLPTKKNLVKRCVATDGHCGLCEVEVEDSIHALWLCDDVKPIWKSTQSFSFLRT